MKSNKSLLAELVSDSVRNVAANLVSLPITFFSSLMIARILGPELTGITSAAIALILTYTINLHLGTLNALSQRYPWLMGQGTPEASDEARRILGVVLGCIGITAAGSAILVLILAAWKYRTGSRLLALGLCFGAVISALQLFKTYYFFLIRSTNQFAFLSRFTLMFAWVPLAWLAGARWGGVVAQWGALAVTELILCVVLYRTVGRNVMWEFDWDACWKYIKLGFPIYIVGTMFGFFTSIDRLAAATLLGTTALGIYGVASMAGTLLGVVPTVITQIMWPRIAEKLGALGTDWRNIFPYIEKPTMLMAFLLPPLIGVVILAIPPATETLLPRYVAGIAAAQISILGVYFLGLMGIYGVFLGTSLRLVPYGVATAIGIVIGVAGSLLSARLNLGLEGMAWVKNISHGVVAIILIFYVGRLFGLSWNALLRRMIVLLSPMAIVYLFVFWLIPLLIPGNAATGYGVLRQLSYQVALLCILSSPLVGYAIHSGGIAGDVASLFRRATRT